MSLIIDNVITKSARTAIYRKNPSQPTKYLIKHGNFNKYISVLNFGCGKGNPPIDSKELSKICKVSNYDPNFHPDTSVLKQKYNVVMCNFVLNVLPQKERNECVQQIRNCLVDGGTAYISVISQYDRSLTRTILKQNDFISYDDGIILKNGCFKKYFIAAEFTGYLKNYFNYVLRLDGDDHKTKPQFYLALCRK